MSSTAEQEPALILGPGQYDAVSRTYTVKMRGGTFTYNRPPHEPLHPKTGAPLLGPDSPTVTIACRIYNLKGQWPGWFLWIVGWPVPARFRRQAGELALRQVKEELREATGWPTQKIVRKAVEHTVHRSSSRLVLLPTHGCAPGEGNSCGPVDAEMRAVCTTRRTFRQEKRGNERVFVPVDSPGCGAVFVLNHHGLRVQVK